MTGYLPKSNTPTMPKAACKGMPTDWFYAEDCLSPVKETVEYARQICIGCPERKLCLDYALENEPHGMWGGLTSNDRKDLQKNRLHKLQHLVDLGLIMEQ